MTLHPLPWSSLPCCGIHQRGSTADPLRSRTRTAPVFTVQARAPIRALAFGDFGEGNEPQRRTAAAMVAYHGGHPFDFGITLGDNFYPSGISSLDDPRWKSQFEDLYGPMGIKFYATLGITITTYREPDDGDLVLEIESRLAIGSPYYTFVADPCSSLQSIPFVCRRHSSIG